MSTVPVSVGISLFFCRYKEISVLIPVSTTILGNAVRVIYIIMYIKRLNVVLS